MKKNEEEEGLHVSVPLELTTWVTSSSTTEESTLDILVIDNTTEY